MAGEGSGAAATLLALEGIAAAQRGRAEAYAALHGSFARCLAGEASDAEFDAAVAGATRAFAALSTEVNAAEAVLRAEPASRTDLADGVRALQNGEKRKLNLTCTLQVLRKAHAAGKWTWQQEDSAADPRGTLRPDWARGCATHPSAACGCAAAAEPTEEEYANAVKEATQGLQECVEAINDELDALREAEMELREELGG